MPSNEQSNSPVLERTSEHASQSAPLNGAAQLPPTSHPLPVATRPWWKNMLTPAVVLLVAIWAMIALLSFGVKPNFSSSSSSDNSANSSASSSSSSASSGSMGNMGGSTAASTQNVPNATQQYGGQPAKYVIDPDGAKHFTFTAEQVMWETVKGHRVLATTINGTVPGPAIRVTAGDHLRITVINHLPQNTTLHWHGLMLPMNEDGVPGLGQNPIKPGQTFTYDFTVHDQDVGTHWYHSHDNDLTQVPDGLYGAFIIDPRPGTPQYQQYTQALKADVEVTDFISEMGGYFIISGKSFPDTQPMMLKHGQTVHIRLIGASEMMHPMHMHGGFFNIVAEDGHVLAQPIQKDTVQVAPGETYDLTMYGWADPGSIYPFHCHILSHVMNPGQTGEEMGGLIQLVEYAKA